jgi:predicted transcriptional regulator
MSIRLIANVLDYVHGLPHGTKLVLLCLADNANDSDLAWPSFETLARRCDMTRRHVIRVMAELEKAGLICRFEERPYKPTKYRLLIPSSDTHVTSDVKDTSDTHVTTLVTPTSLGSDAHVTTTSDAHVTQTIKRTIKEPPIEPSVAVRSETHQLVDAWAERRGFAPTSWPKASKLAKQLHDAGCSVAELMELYDYLADDPFWSDKGFDLGTAVSQLERFRQLHRTPKAKKKTGMEAQMEATGVVR